MAEYGFTENVDFIGFEQKSSKLGGRPSVDHALKIDMAKEISMIQRNEKGKQARQYFIEVEKELKQQLLPQTPEQQIALLAQGNVNLNKIGKTAILSRFYFIFFLLLFIIVQHRQQNLSIWKVLT